VGRPSLYDPKRAPTMARVLCILGATNPEIAEAFGVSLNTIDNWRKEHPAFDEALTKGKTWADARVVQALFMRAVGFRKHGKYYPPDITAIIWWMKNRMGWRDKPEGEEQDPQETVRGIAEALAEIARADGTA
jgi:hypothetical protein